MPLNVFPQPQIIRDTYPLPLFGVWSNYNNNPILHVYDSDIAPVSISATPSYAYTSHEMYSAYTTQNYTNALVGTNSANYTIAGCSNNSYIGHQFVLGSATGAFSHQDVNNIAAYFVEAGTTIPGVEGSRPDWYIAGNDTTLYMRQRNSHSTLDTLAVNTSYATAPTGTQRGMVSYNDRTRRLVMITALDAANNYRMHIWTAPNNRLTGKPGELRTFCLNAKNEENGAYYRYRDFSWSTASSSSHNESRYRMTVIADDRGNVACARFTPSAGLNYMILIAAGAGWNTPVDYESLAATTSYGYEQGNRWGIRSNISWDNNWIATYAPYYYYGSGINAFFIDTRDAEKYYFERSTSTSIGYQILPIKQSSFIMGQSDNADGTQGMRFSLYDPQAIQDSGYKYDGTSVANGAQITGEQRLDVIDTGYTSTNYPCLIPISSWRTWKG